MADSQNTYQNDVSISSNSSSKIIKSIVGVAAAAVIGFFGYNFHTTEIENSYNEGYTKGKEFGKESGYSIGYGEGYTEGYDIGYDIASEKADSNSYDKGYNAGYDKGYNTGYDVGYDKGKSSSYSNNTSSDSSDGYFKTPSSSSNNNTSSSNPKTYDYILNKNTDKFHYSWCSSVGQMKEKNKIYFTGTRTEVINKGYAPCKNCNP